MAGGKLIVGLVLVCVALAARGEKAEEEVASSGKRKLGLPFFGHKDQTKFNHENGALDGRNRLGDQRHHSFGDTDSDFDSDSDNDLDNNNFDRKFAFRDRQRVKYVPVYVPEDGLGHGAARDARRPYDSDLYDQFEERHRPFGARNNLYDDTGRRPFARDEFAYPGRRTHAERYPPVYDSIHQDPLNHHHALPYADRFDSPTRADDGLWGASTPYDSRFDDPLQADRRGRGFGRLRHDKRRYRDGARGPSGEYYNDLRPDQGVRASVARGLDSALRRANRASATATASASASASASAGASTKPGSVNRFLANHLA